MIHSFGFPRVTASGGALPRLCEHTHRVGPSLVEKVLRGHVEQTKLINNNNEKKQN